jgi:hypothetical protein
VDAAVRALHYGNDAVVDDVDARDLPAFHEAHALQYGLLVTRPEKAFQPFFTPPGVPVLSKIHRAKYSKNLLICA